MFQDVEDLVRDSPAGDPGWSELLDLDRCPPEALDWLGQFVGIRIPAGLNDLQSRAWISSTDGFRRGTRRRDDRGRPGDADRHEDRPVPRTVRRLGLTRSTRTT